jgi:hypothetical protein
MLGKFGTAPGPAAIGKRRVFGLLLALGLGSTALPGCGDPNATSRQTLYPVKGKVVLADGNPLSNGRVVFFSEKGIEIDGTVTKDGTFTLSSSLGEGAPEGKYKVRVEPDATGQSGSSKKSSSRRTATWTAPYAARFSDESTSGLAETVKPGDNNFEFKLSK